MDGKPRFAGAQARQRLQGRLANGRSGDVAKKEEPLSIGPADECRPRIARAEKVNGGVLQTVVAPESGEQRTVQDDWRHCRRVRRIIAPPSRAGLGLMEG